MLQRFKGINISRCTTHSFSYIRPHDWICQYSTLLMYQVLDCTRFSFTRFFVFFEMYQVSKYQVFQKSIRFKVPGWRKYQVKSTRTWYFFVQPGKKKKPMYLRTEGCIAGYADLYLHPVFFPVTVFPPLKFLTVFPPLKFLILRLATGTFKILGTLFWNLPRGKVSISRTFFV